MTPFVQCLQTTVLEAQDKPSRFHRSGMKETMMTLQGKKSAVTGASGAIGSAFASALVQEGAEVALINVTFSAVEALAGCRDHRLS